jgi:hypothetical protein
MEEKASISMVRALMDDFTILTGLLPTGDFRYLFQLQGWSLHGGIERRILFKPLAYDTAIKRNR